MNSLEDRLVADAARVRRADPPAPPLDMYLDRAIGASRRGTVLRWLAVAAVLIVVAGVATALALRSNTSSEPPASGGIPLPTPHTIVRNGVTFTVGESSPVGATRDASDPNVVDLYMFDHYDASQPDCSRFGVSARVVQQTSSKVEIASFDYSKAPLAIVMQCAYPGNAVPKLHQIRVQLDASLGTRTVIDARTGKPLSLLTKRAAPRPAYLPAGYRLNDYQGFNPPQQDDASLDYQNGHAVLSLLYMEASLGSPYALVSGGVLGHAAVNGGPATVINYKHDRCLSWADRSGIQTLLCSTGTLHPLPLAELLKVARSIRF